jgi:hypothetical protein
MRREQYNYILSTRYGPGTDPVRGCMRARLITNKTTPEGVVRVRVYQRWYSLGLLQVLANRRYECTGLGEKVNCDYELHNPIETSAEGENGLTASEIRYL